MATRCLIRLHELNNVIKIYRHSDGYPEGVLSDLLAFKEIYPDFNAKLRGIEYWVSNFIFYIKLAKLLSYKDKFKLEDVDAPWILGYGILSNDEECEKHVDYVYDLYFTESEVRVRIYHCIDKKVIFEGSLEDAVKKFNVRRNGCHLKLNIIKNFFK